MVTSGATAAFSTATKHTRSLIFENPAEMAGFFCSSFLILRSGASRVSKDEAAGSGLMVRDA